MARLPQPGGDSGNWGDILNDYLAQSHDTDGTVKNGVVSVSKISATGGTDGQVLSKNSGGTGGLQWITPPGASGGEANTASNVGVGGVGVFKQKTGVNLEFKNINAGSNKVTITNDAGNNEVDIDVAPANFTGIPESAVTNLTTDLSGKTDKSTLTTKGDIYAATGANTPARVAVGTNGQVLTADSTQATGVRWSTTGTALSYPNNSGTATIVPRPSVVNVRDYGATGDGTTDDRPAIVSAISALDAAGGGTLLLPKGTYAISDTVQLVSNMRLVGVGRGATTIKPSASWGGWAMVQDPGGSITNTEVSGITFDAANQVAESLRFIVAGTKNITVRDCEFKNLPSSAAGLVLNLCSNVHIENNIFTGLGSATQRALLMFNSASHITVIGNMFTGFNMSIGIDNFTAPCHNISIFGNRFKNIGGYGIRMNEASYVTVSGNEFESTFYVGGTEDGSMAVSAQSGSTAITISDNISKNSGEISVYDSFDAAVTGNVLIGTIAAGIEINDNQNANTSSDGIRVSVTGNHITNAGGAGVFASGSDILIQGNTMRGSGGSGIKIAEGGERYMLIGNSISNSGESGITVANNGDAGAITASLIADNICYDDQGVKTQEYGLIIFNSITDEIRIIDNDFTGNLTGAVSVFAASTLTFRGNVGYNNQGTAAISVGASPYTYTAGNTPEAVYISGGTVSNVSKNGNTIFAGSPATVWLDANEQLTVTYSVTPTMVKDRK
jgi:hypothetical protein